MKWLLNVIVKFLTYDDPKITPIPVRAAACFLIIATTVIIECQIWLHTPLLRSLAAWGAVLVIFAHSIRHWTGIASDQELQRVSNEIAKIGSSTKLSVWDSTSVIFVAFLTFVIAYLLSAAAVQIAKQHPSQARLPIWLALIGLWMIFFPTLEYLRRKMPRCLASRWRVRLKGDTSKTEIKRILGNVSFAITVVAVVLTLPNLLF